MTKNIYEALDRVQNETYGKDVRQAIVDAVQQTYDDAAFVGNVNMEVISARGRDVTLGARLESVDGELLRRISKGSIVGSDFDISSDSKRLKMENLSDEVRRAMTGNAQVNVTPAPNSVTTETVATNAVTRDKIAFEPSMIDYIDDFIINNNTKITYSRNSLITITITKNVGLWLRREVGGTTYKLSLSIKPQQFTLPNWSRLVWDLMNNEVKVVFDKDVAPAKYLILAHNENGDIVSGRISEKIATLGKSYIVTNNIKGITIVDDVSKSTITLNTIGSNVLYYADALIKKSIGLQFPIILENWESLLWNIDLNELLKVKSFDMYDLPYRFLEIATNSERKLSGYLETLCSTTTQKKLSSIVYDLNLELNHPSYYDTHINSKLSTIRQLERTYGRSGVTFGYITDMHWTTNSKNSNMLLKTVGQNTTMSVVFNNGDLVNNADDVETVINQMVDINAAFKKTGLTVYNSLGNHDDNSYYRDWSKLIKDNMIYPSLFKHNEERVTGERNYYYLDNIKQKVRYIVLDNQDVDDIKDVDNSIKYPRQWTYVYQKQQLDWLKNVALDTPTGYTVVVFTHVPPTSNVTGFDTLPHNSNMLLDILKAYKNKTSLTTSSDVSVPNEFKTTSSVNFTGKGGDVVGVFGGHVHYDNIIKENEINIITTINDSYVRWSDAPERTKGTITEQAFDIVTIDKTTRTVNLTRVGAGSDRNFKY